MEIDSLCPVCGRIDKIILTDIDIKTAKDGHQMIIRSIEHEDHILTLHIDYQGRIRRTATADLIEKKEESESYFDTF